VEHQQIMRAAVAVAQEIQPAQVVAAVRAVVVMAAINKAGLVMRQLREQLIQAVAVVAVAVSPTNLPLAVLVLLLFAMRIPTMRRHLQLVRQQLP
jgi:hypothetical protein